jgi:ribosomal protein L11 methyltransferase
MNYYLYRLIDPTSTETLQHELEKKGLKDTFVIEDDSTGEVFVGGHAKKQIKTPKAILVEEKPAEVNWSDQWALFAENFQEGKAHIQCGEKILLLTPGAGFGDLSHPTTYLMLEMLKTYAKDESIIDIGTGSGVLALAALLLGAKSAIGIDIDEAAIKHAKENAKLNCLKAKFTKILPKNLSKDNIMLMNMIFPEQVGFNPKRLNYAAKLWIASGILEEEREKYLEQTKKWGWTLIETHPRAGWVGCVFCSPHKGINPQ